MAENKLLSVIIPVYNTGAYLSRCISGIQKQTYSNLEIICVDNNSSDNSLDILKGLRSQDDRIVILEEKKPGVSAARNMGIKNAHGDLITFVDSDDAIASEMYEVQVGILEREQADIVHCGYRRYEPDGSYRDISGTGEYLIENKWRAIEHLLKGEKYIGSLCNKIYRKVLFLGQEMDESLVHNEDLLLNFQLFSAADKTVFLDEPYYWYYIRKESASSSSNTKLRRLNALSVSEKVWHLFENSEVRDAAANKYYYDLVCAYRTGVFAGRTLADYGQRRIKESIQTLEASEVPLSGRNRLDFRFMKTAPVLYRICYSVYNQIRKPNWDVK